MEKSESENDNRETFLRWAIIIGILVFAGVWIYAMSEWGFLFGIIFGWIPALIAGVVGGFVLGGILTVILPWIGYIIGFVIIYYLLTESFDISSSSSLLLSFLAAYSYKKQKDEGGIIKLLKDRFAGVNWKGWIILVFLLVMVILMIVLGNEPF